MEVYELCVEELPRIYLSLALVLSIHDSVSVDEVLARSNSVQVRLLGHAACRGLLPYYGDTLGGT